MYGDHRGGFGLGKLCTVAIAITMAPAISLAVATAVAVDVVVAIIFVVVAFLDNTSAPSN